MDTSLGFDYGLKRIGVAVGQSITGTASPLPALACRDGQPDWERVEALLKEWRPGALIVGLPYNTDGGEQPISTAARRFARRLTGRFGLPVYLVDERYSSASAEARLAETRQQGRRRVRKTDIDSAAACIILESWLNGAEAIEP